METLLLIIDMQYDFCSPDGALYVRGAEDDVARLAAFITINSGKINHIILTQDNHQVIDISHPGFWEDRDGNPPEPFTVITPDDIRKSIWTPRFDRERAVDYVYRLEKQGEFPHVIWPEHCIMGSHGAAITDELMKPVRAWARRGNYFDVIIKGTNPLTEHFGALRANIPVGDDPGTQINMDLVRKLRHYDTILVAGEASSHCVANTVRQMLDIGGIAPKLVILEDCMSDVTGFETIALPVYEKARSAGSKFVKSTEWT
jgi:nicotinamidase-related amidase